MQNFEDLEKLKADKSVVAIIFFKHVKTGELKIAGVTDPMSSASGTAEINAKALGEDWSWIVYHRFANIEGFGSFGQSSNYTAI